MLQKVVAIPKDILFEKTPSWWLYGERGSWIWYKVIITRRKCTDKAQYINNKDTLVG